MSAGSTPEAATPRIQFAPEDDVAIRYMDRTREYYQALGFSPYRWAHFTDAPFTPLRLPLAKARVALITTAAPFQPGAGDQTHGLVTDRSAGDEDRHVGAVLAAAPQQLGRVALHGHAMAPVGRGPVKARAQAADSSRRDRFLQPGQRDVGVEVLGDRVRPVVAHVRDPEIGRASCRERV